MATAPFTGFVPPNLAVLGQPATPGFGGQPGTSSDPQFGRLGSFINPGLANQQGGGAPGFGGGSPTGFPGGQGIAGDLRGALGGGLTNVANRSENLFQAGPQQFFPGSTVAPFNPFQLQSAQNAFGTLNQGQPLQQAAQASAFGALNPFSGGNVGAETLGQFSRGDFVGANPFLSQAFNQQIAPAIRENVNTSFLQGGRFGSPANTRTLARELGSAATGFFGQNFANEQRNRLSAAGQLGNLGLQTQGQAPGLTGGFLQNQLQGFNLGGQFQQQQQAGINEQINRFNFQQQAPRNLLAEQLAFLNPINIGQFQTPNAPQTSQTQDVLGTAFGGIGAAAQFANLCR